MDGGSIPSLVLLRKIKKSDSSHHCSHHCFESLLPLLFHAIVNKYSQVRFVIGLLHWYRSARSHLCLGRDTQSRGIITKLFCVIPASAVGFFCLIASIIDFAVGIEIFVRS